MPEVRDSEYNEVYDYVVDEIVYTGFRAMNQNRKPKIVAMCLFDGDNDLFELDPMRIPKGLEELKHYYADGYDRLPTRIDVYKFLSADLTVR